MLVGGNPLTRTTNASGLYLFDGLPVGNYYVVFDLSSLPAGYAPTLANVGSNDEVDSDADANGKTAATGPISAGQQNLSLDLGIFAPYSVGNRVWEDNNNNGVIDSGEAGINGLTVNLYADANNDGTPDGVVLASMATANGGYYRFDDLNAGSYYVRIPASEFAAGGKLAGYSSSVGQTGTFTTTDNNRDHGDDVVTDGVTSQKVTLGVSEPLNEVDAGATGAGTNGLLGDAKDNLTVDFGFVRQSFGNQVWIETDNDGVFEAGEVPVTGHVLTATSSTGVVYTTTTDVNGQYTFTVPAGVYTVTYGAAPTGTTPSVTPGGSTVNNASPDNQSHSNNTVVTLGAGEVIRSVILGLSSGVRKSLVLATALTERIIDAGVLLLMAVVMLQFTDKFPASIRESWFILLPIVAAILLAVFLSPFIEGLLHKIPQILPANAGIKEKLRGLISGMLDGVRVFHNVRLLAVFLLTTVLIWCIDAIVFIMLAMSLDSTLTIPQAIIFVAALGFASSIPSTPGFVGVFQAVAVILLPIFGIPADRAFLLVSIMQLMGLVTTGCLGGIGWFVMQRRLGAARLEQELAEAD